MKKRLVFLFAILLLAMSYSYGFDYFQNSTRRTGTAEEARAIVHVAPGCAGFFVKNSGNRPYVATARHCVNYALNDVCNGRDLRITAQLDVRDRRGICGRIIASHPELDMAIVEVNFRNWETLRTQISFLTLSAEPAQLNTRLVMIGYPSDPQRRKRFTVTENCWVNNGRRIQTNEFSRGDRRRNREVISNIVRNPIRNQLRGQNAALHNCSVYGGNSGGPMLIEGTSIVLGMPTSYYPGVFTEFDETRSQGMDSTAMFIEMLRSEVTSAGIEVAYPYRAQQ